MTDRNLLITGATGGLGRVFADTLGELGANLILVDLPGTVLDSITNKLKEKWNVKVTNYEVDLEIDVQRRSLVNSINRDFNQLNILVNNAGFVGTTHLLGWNEPFKK